VERPRPLGSLSHVGHQTNVNLANAATNRRLSAQDVSTVEEIIQLLEQVESNLKARNYDKIVVASVVKLNVAMKSYGSQVELFHRELLDRAQVALRNACKDTSLDIVARLHLLEIIELRSMKWVLNESVLNYYRQKLSQIDVLQDHDGSRKQLNANAPTFGTTSSLGDVAASTASSSTTPTSKTSPFGSKTSSAFFAASSASKKPSVFGGGNTSTTFGGLASNATSASTPAKNDNAPTFGTTSSLGDGASPTTPNTSAFGSTTSSAFFGASSSSKKASVFGGGNASATFGGLASNVAADKSPLSAFGGKAPAFGMSESFGGLALAGGDNENKPSQPLFGAATTTPAFGGKGSVFGGFSSFPVPTGTPGSAGDASVNRGEIRDTFYDNDNDDSSASSRGYSSDES